MNVLTLFYLFLCIIVYTDCYNKINKLKLIKLYNNINKNNEIDKISNKQLNNYNIQPKTISNHQYNLLNSLYITGLVLSIPIIANSQETYPIVGSPSLMSKKLHGTSNQPVQKILKYNCNVELADKICNYNRHWAENAGYFVLSTSFMKEAKELPLPIVFYDSVTGVPLFKAPVSRSLDNFLSESIMHGWPSFRDNEVVWSNVRSLPDGEMVSLTGTHLGHNLPDRLGNRYCINLVSIAGYPSST